MESKNDTKELRDENIKRFLGLGLFFIGFKILLLVIKFIKLLDGVFFIVFIIVAVQVVFNVADRLTNCYERIVKELQLGKKLKKSTYYFLILIAVSCTSMVITDMLHFFFRQEELISIIVSAIGTIVALWSIIKTENN